MAESVYSFDSSKLSQFVKAIGGRDSYILPNDELEWSRLDKQHTALFIAASGLTPCMDIVDRVLAPLPDQQRQIVDIGCGSGIWALEMAKKYSHADVLGVDLAPVPMDPSVFPPNLRFEVDDVNYGLTHFYDQFDLIHFRCVGGGITDMRATMAELQKCLKPGGLIIFVGGDSVVLSEDRLHGIKFPTSETDKEGSWTRKLLWEAWQAAFTAGSVISPTEQGEIQDRGLWDHELCAPETAVSGGLTIPIGPWKADPNPIHLQQLQYAGALMRQVFLNLHRGYHGILLKNGMEQRVLDDWSTKVDEELNTMRHKMWVRFRFCWARRRAGPNLPAPPLPDLDASEAPNSPPLTSDSHLQSVSAPQGAAPGAGDPLKARYPFIDFYHSPEEALAMMIRRRECEGEYPVSEAKKARERMLREKARTEMNVE